MQFFKTTLAALAIAAGFTTAAEATTLVTFEGVAGTTVLGANTAPGITAFSLGRSAGLVENTGSTFNSRDWDEGTDKATALANDNTLFWGMNIDALTPYDLGSLEIDYDRSGTGPTQMAIDLFVGGVFQAEVFTDTTVADSASQTALVDLSAFSSVTGNIGFRLSAWGATSSLGTFDIENDLFGDYGIIVSGTRAATAAVPLPASGVLLIGALGLLGLRRRRG